MKLKRKLRHTVSVRLLMAVMMLIVACQGVYGTENHSAAGDVLVVSGYTPYYRWSNRVIAEVKQELKNSGKGNVECMYLPIVGARTISQLDSLSNCLRSALRKMNPRIVVLVGVNSAVFCNDIHSVDPNISMMLVAGDRFISNKQQIVEQRIVTPETRFPLERLRKKYNLTVQCMDYYLEGEMKLITRLMPQLQNVYMVCGDDPFSRTKCADLERVVKKNHSHVGFHAIEAGSVSTDSLIRTVSHLNGQHDAVVFASWISYNSVGEKSMLMNSAIYLMEASTAPTFVLRDNGWIAEGYRVVGGCVADEQQFFNDMRQALKKLINGASAKQVPSNLGDKQRILLNYRRMADLGLDTNLIPDNAIVYNAPESILDKYGTEIVMVSGGVIMLILLLLLGFMRQSMNVKNLRIRDLEAVRRFSSLIQNIPIVFTRARVNLNSRGEIDDLTIMYGNDKFCNLAYGAGKSGVEGMSLRKALPQSGGTIIQKLKIALENHSNGFDMVLDVWTGAYCAMYVAIDNGDVDIFAVDVSETIKYQNELEQANAMLKQAKEKAEANELLKTRFIQNMSHEIRTPLNAICGFAEVLANEDYDLSDADRREYTSIISSNCQMLINLVDDILYLSDLNSGKRQANYSHVHVNELCRFVLRTLELRRPNGVEMLLDSDVDDDYSIYSDEKRLQQVLVNFVTNAIKHTSQGKIVIQFRHGSDHNGQWWEFACADTGTGVPPEQADKIFDRFFKLDSFKQGTGLGLSICRSVAKMLGGEVSLDTSYTQGARFVFRLRASHDSAQKPQ
ncbi:MAG: ATP-binding protein [Muribaculaceae bacterium]